MECYIQIIGSLFETIYYFMISKKSESRGKNFRPTVYFRIRRIYTDNTSGQWVLSPISFIISKIINSKSLFPYFFPYQKMPVPLFLAFISFFNKMKDNIKLSFHFSLLDAIIDFFYFLGNLLRSISRHNSSFQISFLSISQERFYSCLI